MEEKRNLYFQRSNGEMILLLENCTESEAMDEMNQFMKEHNFKSYYTRTWSPKEDEKIYDTGSWSEYFYWSNRQYEIDGGIKNA